MEKEAPNIIGPNGGRARCFAVISVSFNTGLTLGPVVAGRLFSSIGYCYLNIVLGRLWPILFLKVRLLIHILGSICLGVAVVTFLFIDL